MPSFDVVSEVNPHELANAIDQANRELANRFDFRGLEASFVLEEDRIVVTAPEEFQLDQMADILREKMARRKVDSRALKDVGLEGAGKSKRRTYRVLQGVDGDSARTIVRLIKDSKLKVQAAIQGDKVRVTGKKRDDLQQVIAMLREAKLERPLQFNNFRD
jgi:uncharacterized protein YajQ (UPF0234 family)